MREAGIRSISVHFEYSNWTDPHAKIADHGDSPKPGAGVVIAVQRMVLPTGVSRVCSLVHLDRKPNLLLGPIDFSSTRQFHGR